MKRILKNFLELAAQPDPINDISDYRRVDTWIKRTKKLYRNFLIAGAVFTIIGFILLFSSGMLNTPLFLLALPLLPFLIFFTACGYATLVLYFPTIFKSIVKAGSAGYDIGKNIETTHVNVTHEFGNTYRVSSYTENKGCLFAYISGFAKFFLWMVFCVYIGPFVTYKKLRASLKKLAAYDATKSQAQV